MRDFDQHVESLAVDSSEWLPVTDHPDAVRINPALQHVPAIKAVLGTGLIYAVARNSGENGRAAIDSTATNVHSGALSALRHGIDFRHCLPSVEQIADRFAEPNHVIRSRTEYEKKPFANSFVIIDMRERGLIVNASVGPASKLDEHGRQPVIELLTEEIKRHQPGLLYTHIIDRILRTTWPAGPLMSAIDGLERHRNKMVFLGDGAKGFRDKGDFADLQTMLEARSAAEAAKDLPFRSRSASLTRTDEKMIDGRARCAFPHWLPFPLAMETLANRRTGREDHYLIIDTPAARSDCRWDDELERWVEDRPENLLRRPPLFYDPNGRIVDQIQNFDFITEHLYLPEWPRSRIRAEMVRRQFSSDGLRRHHGDPTKIIELGDPMLGASAMDSIVKNLPFFLTNNLKLNIGVPRLPESVTICDVHPPGRAEWIPQPHRDRIRAGRVEWTLRRAGEHRLALDQFPVTVNDESATLRQLSRIDNDNFARSERGRFELPESRPT